MDDNTNDTKVGSCCFITIGMYLMKTGVVRKEIVDFNDASVFLENLIGLTLIKQYARIWRQCVMMQLGVDMRRSCRASRGDSPKTKLTNVRIRLDSLFYESSQANIEGMK
jgi:hypothetical protein